MMTKHDDEKPMSLVNSSNKRKWFTLGLVGAALLLIPRRSSRQDSISVDKNTQSSDSNHH